MATNQPANLWQKIVGLFVRQKPLPEPEPDDELCCDGVVHIAFRGLADDRMYLVRDRKWSEVKYYRQNGLRVFCAGCRRRVL